MASIKLTVKRLYALQNERMVRTHATATVYVGDQPVATEEISGLTETPVSKYIHHQLTAGQPVRVEWQTPGIADMTVTEMEICPCCHPADTEI
ncbi:MULTISPECIES: hypothetical protein [unclassified Tatumella]|uniref:hypothetical protein n=1 Tax=unclassified Tatumella TaxID=2649542 RepID=UPI001BAEBA4C|nr:MULTISPECIES: hypothetical protein [unclassified Tatumella]MBS0856690.1 hypothetical protein [Tatumella sp. JGM16]MBS0878029.1 hypothetical protein [Tatumella sp. JGM82]MBS0891248.1 hypothetical protein [Tatumella sp. JGM94]MBS0895141.1 hypothetical protein [Tatumella sp. JGM130]MBS0902627.1 hypothetical protein [Tatumella sp. JGM100]